jgi:hypothetical protein
MTAVEWLIEQYMKDGLFKEGVYEQAKEMEKQQQGYSEEDMREAFEWGVAHITFEDWLKQFKNK